MASQFQQTFEDRIRPASDRAFGVAVVFQRGIREIPITATGSDVEYEIVGDEGVKTSVAMREYQLSANLLALDGNAIEPRSGDFIKETINGVSQTFEALPAANRPACQQMQGGFRWLIRTKRVK